MITEKSIFDLWREWFDANGISSTTSENNLPSYIMMWPHH